MFLLSSACWYACGRFSLFSTENSTEIAVSGILACEESISVGIGAVAVILEHKMRVGECANVDGLPLMFWLTDLIIMKVHILLKQE